MPNMGFSIPVEAWLPARAFVKHFAIKVWKWVSDCFVNLLPKTISLLNGNALGPKRGFLAANLPLDSKGIICNFCSAETFLLFNTVI